MMVAAAEIGDFFHHVALLVYLDGEDAAIVVLVASLLNSAGKGFVQLLDTVVEQVFNAQYSRHGEAALFHAVCDVDEGHIDAVVIGRVYRYHGIALDRKSTRLNSSHVSISYAVFCL